MLRAAEYERTLYMPRERTYRDMREGMRNNTPMPICHGSSGIAIARSEIIRGGDPAPDAPRRLR